MILEKDCFTIIKRNQETKLTFRFQPHRISLDYYLGCKFGCVYCYAVHSVMNQGWDFDGFSSNNVVYTNAAEVLNRELTTHPWQKYSGIFQLGDIQDCYQPIEHQYKVTRSILHVLLEKRKPTCILTKSPLVTNDLDILQELATHDLIQVDFSISSSDEEMRKIVEPHAPPISSRYEAIGKLCEAGIPVGIFIKPAIPGITENGIDELIKDLGKYPIKYILLDKLSLTMPQQSWISKKIKAENLKVAWEQNLEKKGFNYYPTWNYQRAITQKVNKLCHAYNIPFISPHLLEFHTGNYDFGIFKYRYPLIYDYIDLFITKDESIITFDMVRSVASLFTIDDRYIHMLEQEWFKGELFPYIKGWNITSTTQSGEKVYLVRKLTNLGNGGQMTSNDYD